MTVPNQRILVVDDDPMIHKLVTLRLKDLNAAVLCAESGAAGMAMALTEQPHLILLDVGLPDISGFNVCTRLRDDPLTREIPIIFLTGTDDSTEKVRAFEMGAVDYVTKPFNSAELRARVRAALRMQALIEALETQALSDKLTGLPNREAFRRAVSHCLTYARSHAPEYKFAVLFLDLDRFKVVNDSLGHSVGDQLIVAVANQLYRSIRHSPRKPGDRLNDMVARLGGDEFAVLLHDVKDEASVQQIAQRLQDDISKPHHLDGHIVSCSTSVGIRMSDSNAEDVDTLLRDSDTAMYHAKASGKAHAALFDAQMHEKAMRRLHIETSLRCAIDERTLGVVYQPIVSLTTNKLMSLEALLRLNDPNGEPIEPMEFLPIAEETGHIHELGRWIIREACMQAREWNRSFNRNISISVNLSRIQLSADTIEADIAQAIRDSNIAPSDLILEITEGVIMHSSNFIVPTMQRLRNLGVTLAMDDFGTGSSSLASLHRFPIDIMKVDREFIRRLNDNRPYAAIVHAIITLAHNLNLRIVAKGVETAEQLALLQALDCDAAQGFYFKAPLTAGEVEQLLSQDVVLKLAA